MSAAAVIDLPFPPSSNNLFINVRRGRIRSSKYAEWAAEAGWELKRQRAPELKGPVSLFYQLQDGRDKRKRDLGNLEKAVTDLLVEYGVIEADDNTIVREINLSWSTEARGVHIVIYPAGESNGRSQLKRTA